jgi:hypothetical protein
MTKPRLERPMAPASPPSGILAAEHFQMAYATNDIDRAKQLFADRYGITRWTKLAGNLDQGGRIHVELAWVGPLMYELMFAEGPGSETYRAVLTGEPQFQLRHHHLGYMIHDQGSWDQLMALVAREGWSMPLNRSNPGFLTSCMVHAPEPGHFLEYIFPEPAGLDFFNMVERN